MEDNLFKKIWKFLHSMKFGIILLIIIGISSISGTIIPQHKPIGHYEHIYSPFIFKMIQIFSLDRVFSSWWFIIMILLLSLNLILCSIKRLPKILNKLNRRPDFNSETLKKMDFKIEINDGNDSILKDLGYRNIEKNSTSSVFYARKNTIGYFGSWITHIALLIIILSYSFGKLTGFDAFIYGIPGSIQNVLDTDYYISINDFDIKFRDDYTVEQYISDITLEDRKTGYEKSGKVTVNGPFRGEGINIYQNGTGWATDISLLKNGDFISEKTIYQSEVLVEDNQRIAIQFVQFFPDYENLDGKPITKSPFLNNPKFLYSIYYEGFRVDMNIVSPGELVEFEEYSFVIKNPQMFTLLQVVKDSGNIPAAIGGILLIIGIFLAFYIIPSEIYIVYEGKEKFIYARSLKNKEDFKKNIEEKVNELEGV